MVRSFMKDFKRIVIKVGTNSIMNTEDGKMEVNFRQLDRLAFAISTLQQEGKEVVLVSSGAVGVGAASLGMDAYPDELVEKQALAAIGQGILMGHYGRFFDHYNQVVAQVLLTRDVIDFPTSLENVERSMESLINKGVVPIINENDTVAVEELDHLTKFGDNDTLSAIVASIVKADVLVILSDVEGLYDKNPHEYEDAQLLSYIPEITDQVIAMAGGKGSEFAMGGMATKLSAAKIMLDHDAAMVITDASEPTVLFRIFDGDQVGTLFMKEDN
ncbi:glutamate 5-kinase [Hutsoniella sourekii]|uniref:glutamate 5-kinase n=1 Tax=Hutsoniella sourekii TaxID=87650 RepID=UPI000484FC14|nr:glutamate 5-kinase [Hutsoniella sourekii]